MADPEPAVEDASRSAVPNDEGTVEGSVVVGHDGSAGAEAALREGLTLARALGAPLVLVRAWSLVTAPHLPGEQFGYTPGLEEFGKAVHASLIEDAAAATAEFPDVPVTYRTPHEGATQALVGLSAEARLLVVGARGSGGLVGMLVGSVGEQCSRHASCSVLIARSR
ncbi:MAG: universal stress protein [Nocardioides sp.]